MKGERRVTRVQQGERGEGKPLCVKFRRVVEVGPSYSHARSCSPSSSSAARQPRRSQTVMMSWSDAMLSLSILFSSSNFPFAACASQDESQSRQTCRHRHGYLHGSIFFFHLAALYRHLFALSVCNVLQSCGSQVRIHEQTFVKPR